MTDMIYSFPGIEGKRALVTGAAAGIGRATAILLDQMGANITIADINAEGLTETDLPLLSGPPFKLEFGGYGRPVGLTVTQCRAAQQGEAR